VAAYFATRSGVIAIVALSGDAALAKVWTIGPFSPNGASCTCAETGAARLCVQSTASEVAPELRSAVHVAVAALPFGGTTCAPFAVNATASMELTIWPRISPAGRPAVWMLM
jgi:hypothetical protein